MFCSNIRNCFACSHCENKFLTIKFTTHTQRVATCALEVVCLWDTLLRLGTIKPPHVAYVECSRVTHTYSTRPNKKSIRKPHDVHVPSRVHAWDHICFYGRLHSLAHSLRGNHPKTTSNPKLPQKQTAAAAIVNTFSTCRRRAASTDMTIFVASATSCATFFGSRDTVLIIPFRLRAYVERFRCDKSSTFSVWLHFFCW